MLSLPRSHMMYGHNPWVQSWSIRKQYLGLPSEELFSILAHGIRRDILLTLMHGPATKHRLAATVDISHHSIYHHCLMMIKANLIETVGQPSIIDHHIEADLFPNFRYYKIRTDLPSNRLTFELLKHMKAQDEFFALAETKGD